MSERREGGQTVKLPLTREQRAALFAGETPKLTFPGSRPCPVKAGHIERLSSNVELEVTSVRRTRKGDWSLAYELRNNRLGSRFLAQQAGQYHPAQYVTSPAGSIDQEAGEAVDELTQKRITREARGREREQAAEVIAAAEDVMAAIKARADASPEFRREARLTIHRMRRELDRLIERQRRKVA